MASDGEGRDYTDASSHDAGSYDVGSNADTKKPFTMVDFLRPSYLSHIRPATSEYLLEREELHGYDDGSDWTASRCLRLLRPLRAAIHALREEEWTSRGEASSARQDKKEYSSEHMSFGGTAGIDLYTTSDVEDPDFVPSSQPAKKSRQTYSLRKKKTGSADVTYSTAIDSRRFQLAVQTVERAMADASALHIERLNSSSADETEVVRAETDLDMHGILSQMRSGMNRLQQYDRLFRAFHRLLQATDGKSPHSLLNVSVVNMRNSSSSAAHHPEAGSEQGRLGAHQAIAGKLGARSLFQTCLKKVPGFVEDEQRSVDSKPEPERYDVSNVTYEQLQALSTASDENWGPLRLIVRAHGATLLCEAVRRGLLTPAAIKTHVEACMVGDFADGAKEIIAAWGEALISGHMRTMIPLTQIRSIKSLLGSLGCQSMFWNWMSDSLMSKDVCGTVLKDMETLWTSCVRCFSSDNFFERESAIILVEKLVGSAIGGSFFDLTPRARRGFTEDDHDPIMKFDPRPQDVQVELAPMLSAVLMFLAATATLGNVGKSLQLLVLKRVFDHTEHILSSTPFDDLDDFQKTVALLPWLSIHIIQAFCPEADVLPSRQEPFFGLIAHKNLGEEASACLSRHVMRVARATSRYGGSRLGHLKIYVQRAAEHLLQLSKDKDSSLLANVAVKVAFDFAEHDPKKANTTFALRLETDAGLMVDNDDEGLSSPLAELSERWRWEESISEWVRLTPSTKPKNVNVVVPLTGGIYNGRVRLFGGQAAAETTDEDTVDGTEPPSSPATLTAASSVSDANTFTDDGNMLFEEDTPATIRVVVPEVSESTKKAVQTHDFSRMLSLEAAESDTATVKREKRKSARLSERIPMLNSSPLGEKVKRRGDNATTALQKRQRFSELSLRQDAKGEKVSIEESEDELAI